MALRRRPRGGSAAARRAATSSSSPGGLTNTNYKVTTADGALRRAHLRQGHGPARDRPRERDPQHDRGGRDRRRRAVRRLPARARRARARVHRRRDDERRDSAPRRPARARSPRRAGGCTPAGGSSTTSTCSRSSAATSSVVRERGFRLPDRYVEFEPQVRALERGDARASPSRPCRATTTCSPRTSSRSDGMLRLIDYEYSGNNEPTFELGNVWSESNLSLAQLEELVAALLRAAAAQQGRARPPLGPDVEVRLDALGLDPGRRLRPRLRLLGLGDGEVRARGRGVRRPGLRAAARRGAARD